MTEWLVSIDEVLRILVDTVNLYPVSVAAVPEGNAITKVI
jgi:hypothetical protein